jgi:hypothetical protein
MLIIYGVFTGAKVVIFAGFSFLPVFGIFLGSTGEIVPLNIVTLYGTKPNRNL